MKAASKISEFKSTSFAIISSIAITLFLFYIDEGYYSFAWMKSAVAWIIFSIYAFVFFAIQTIIYHFLTKKKKAALNKLFLAFMVGVPLGFVLLLLLWRNI